MTKTVQNISIVSLFCLAIWTPANALVINGGALGSGPVSLGQAGAVVAAGNESEASFWNPAVLADLHGWTTSALGGSGQVNGLYHAGFAFAAPVSDYGNFGLGVLDTRFTQTTDFRQTLVTGSAAIPVGRKLWLGTNQRLLTAQPGGLAGWSMDLGARGEIELPWEMAGQPQRLLLGVAALDVVSSLHWENGLEESQPLLLQMGATYAFTDSAWLSFEWDRLDSFENGSSGQWRAGGQWGMFDRLLTIRGGATQLDGALLHVSAGLGSVFRLGRTEARIDYALLVPSDSFDSLDSARHLFSVSAGLARPKKVKREPRAAFTKVLRDDKNQIHSAKIGLAGAAEMDVADWELAITDEDGNVLRTYKGKGAMPPNLTWDGRDDDGNLVDAKGLQYDLRTTSTSGETLRRRSILAAAGAGGDDLGDLTEMAGMDAGLRTIKRDAGPMRVKPALRKGDGYELAGADFDLSGVASDDVQTWELRVVDAEGNVVRTFSGSGKPPKSIQWEGTTDLGEPVDGGLGAGFELRVVDGGGKEQRFASDLVQAEDFAAATRAEDTKPRLVAKKELPVLDCRRDLFGRGWICFVRFGYNSARLTKPMVRELGQVARLIKEGRYAKILIHGHADSVGDGEKNLMLSQARADEVMDKLLVDFGIRPESIVAVGKGDTAPLVPEESKNGRAINRRVEVYLRPDVVD